MSTPMSSEQFVRQLQKWGVPFVETDGWRTRNRNSMGAWGPVHGLLLHHTGDDAPDTADERVLIEGRSDLPGPLCHWGMRDDGTAVLIGWGRANHAGVGAANVRDVLLTEGYGAYPPAPGPDSVDGNALLYGQETCYSGLHVMTEQAYRSTVRAFAAVCDHHGWSAKSCIGHKEWTGRKVDPGHLDMASFRRDVDALLEAGPGGDDMALSDDDKAWLKGQIPSNAYLEKMVDLHVAAAVRNTVGGPIATILAAVGKLENVDEAALAADLASLLAQLLPGQLPHLSPADFEAIANAVADEEARRLGGGA